MGETRWLVLGASGGVGRGVLARLDDEGSSVVAVSRSADAATGTRSRLGWVVGDLGTLDPDQLPTPERVVSAGPLDAFAVFAQRARWPAGTALSVLSSMSAATKAERGHRDERAVASRLHEAELALQACARARGWRLVILRPTLIWGRGDRSITPLLALARRIGWLPLPRGSSGRRQPVHADDLAAALLDVLDTPGLAPGPWPAPGGEVLPFDEMIERALAVAVPGTRVRRCPDWICRLGERLLAPLPGAAGVLAHRMRRSRVHLDVGDAALWRALGWRPRGFVPTRDAFPALGPESGGSGRES